METFNCPHCQQEYPKKPALIGKTVRCRTCANPFRLEGDGSVTAIKATAKINKTSVDEAGSKPTSKNSSQAKPQKTGADNSTRLSPEEKAAKAKAKTQKLKNSLSGALKAADASVAAQEQRSSERKKMQSSRIRTAEASGGSKGAKKFSAVLADSGKREGRQRLILFSCLATVIICVLGIFLLSRSHGPIDATLRSYIESGQRNGSNASLSFQRIGLSDLPVMGTYKTFNVINEVEIVKPTNLPDISGWTLEQAPIPFFFNPAKTKVRVIQDLLNDIEVNPDLGISKESFYFSELAKHPDKAISLLAYLSDVRKYISDKYLHKYHLLHLLSDGGPTTQQSLVILELVDGTIWNGDGFAKANKLIAVLGKDESDNYSILWFEDAQNSDYIIHEAQAFALRSK